MLLTYTINKPAATVISYLADTKKFVAVHPVITKMEDAGENKFMVYETLKAGPFPISFKYTAIVRADYVNSIIRMDARVLRLARINMIFIVTECGDYTTIKEEIDFHSWLPIKRVMGRVFKKQHAQLFKNIANSIN